MPCAQHHGVTSRDRKSRYAADGVESLGGGGCQVAELESFNLMGFCMFRPGENNMLFARCGETTCDLEETCILLCQDVPIIGHVLLTWTTFKVQLGELEVLINKLNQTSTSATESVATKHRRAICIYIYTICFFLKLLTTQIRTFSLSSQL